MRFLADPLLLTLLFAARSTVAEPSFSFSFSSPPSETPAPTAASAIVDDASPAPTIIGTIIPPTPGNPISFSYSTESLLSKAPTFAPTVSDGTIITPTPGNPFSFSYSTESPLSKAPTFAPTVSDLAVVDTSMDILADTNPTQEDAAALRSTISMETGVPEENIIDLSIDSAPTTDASQLDSGRRRLSNYVWSVTFTIVVSISETYCGTCGTSAVNFAVFVQTTCAAPRFNLNYRRQCRSCEVEKESVDCIPKTRPPTLSPTPRPTPLPTTLKPTARPTPRPTSPPTPAPTCICTCTEAPTLAPTITKPPPTCLGNKSAVAVEYQRAELRCTSGLTIKVKNAWYGVSTVECQDKNCQNVKPIARKACNGKRTCVVNASNEAMGGDPSRGTEKLLFIRYCCWSP